DLPFGLEVPIAGGTRRNQGEQAYQNISLLAEVYDAEDNLIGEGMGYLVRACGEALVDFALQPGQHMTFSAQLDIFEPEAAVDHVEIFPMGAAIPPTEAETTPEIDGITRVTDAEVVDVEWIDGTNLRYAAGCWRDLFVYQQWFEYNRSSRETTSITHPRANEISDVMRQALRLTDPAIFNRSFYN